MSAPLRTVSTGLTLALTGLLVVTAAGSALVGIGFVIVLGMRGQKPQDQADSEKVLLALVMLCGALVLFGSVLGLVGRALCLAAATAVGATRRPVAASGVLGLFVVAGTALGVADMTAEFLPREARPVIVLVVGAAGAGAAVSLLMFVRSLARHVWSPGLATGVVAAGLVWVAAAAGYTTALNALLVLPTRGAGGKGPAGELAFMVLGLSVLLALPAVASSAIMLAKAGQAVRRQANRERYERRRDDEDV